MKKCRICGCTDERACQGGCSWGTGKDKDLCSGCERFRHLLAIYADLANRVTKASLARLLEEVKEGA